MARVSHVNKDIEALLKPRLTSAGCGYISGWVAEGDEFPNVPELGEQIKPTAILQMGDWDNPDRWRGIVTVKHDMRLLDFSVLNVAPSNNYLLTLCDLVDDILIGAVPNNDCGEVRKIGGNIGNLVRGALHPLRYSKISSYVVPFGANVLL